MKRFQKLQTLKFFHLVFLGLVVLTIVLLHTVPPPFLDFLRMPLFLRAVDPYIGEIYPSSFYLYHTALYFFFAVMFIDLIALTFTKSQFLKTLSSSVSLVGVVVMIVIGGFFVYTLTNGFADALILKGSLAYLAFCSGFFALDLTTFIKK